MLHQVRPASTEHCSDALPQSLPPVIADLADCTVIPLTHQQHAVSHLTVDIAFAYQVAADKQLLLQSLRNTLVHFPVLCGRVLKVRRDDNVSELVLCVPKLQHDNVHVATSYPSWAYVPFTFETNNSINSDVNGVAPNDWFDMAVCCIPNAVLDASSIETDEIDLSILGDPMTRIKVSTTDSGQQVIALSINHLLVDAGSIGLFMSEWSFQYQQCRVEGRAEVIIPRKYEHYSFGHPIFDTDWKGDDEQSQILNEWKSLLPNESGGENPFANNATNMASEDPNISCSIYHRSRDQLEALKKQSMEATIRLGQQEDEEMRGVCIPPYISSNDALLGEVCNQLEATSFLLCMDWRPVLQRNNFFGYAVLFLYIDIPSSSHAPAMCRKLLGWNDRNRNGVEGCTGVVRDAKFVKWKIMNETKQGRTDLIWNSWSDLFTLHDHRDCCNTTVGIEKSSKMECCAHDIFMSDQMCKARVDVARRGLSYAIIFPQPYRSVRVYFFGPTEVGQTLQSEK